VASQNGQRFDEHQLPPRWRQSAMSHHGVQATVNFMLDLGPRWYRYVQLQIFVSEDLFTPGANRFGDQ
jgi:hypothetical protein